MKKKESEKFDLQKQLGYNVYRVGLIFRRELMHCFQEYNITPEQWQVLATLWQQDSLSQVQIGRITLQDPPSLSRMLKRMEKNGYIDKSRNKDEERSTSIKLTKKGTKLMPILKEKIFAHFDDFLSGYPKKKRDELLALLLQLRADIGDQK